MKLFKRLPIILVMLYSLCAASIAWAEIYRWTDENGKVHFSDKVPNDQQSEKLDVKVNTYESVSYDKSIFDTGKKVVMYSTEWCSYCKVAKRYFKRKGIRFSEYDIEKSAKAKRDYNKMGATGVPVILVGNKRMNGFTEQGFEDIYN